MRGMSGMNSMSSMKSMGRGAGATKRRLTQKSACKKTQKEGLKRMNFKACEGEKSAAYQAYVSIFKPSLTQKFAFSGPPTKRFYYL